MTLDSRLAALEGRIAPAGERFGDLSDNELEHALAAEVEQIARRSGSVPAGPAPSDGTERLRCALDLAGVPRYLNGREATLAWRLDWLLEGART